MLYWCGVVFEQMAKFEPCRELIVSDRDAAKAPEEAVRIEEPASPDDEVYGAELTDPIPSRSSSNISYGVLAGTVF